jgi:hypothetical protein
VADVDAALLQQVLDVPQGQRKPDVGYHCPADDLGARVEVRGGLGLVMLDASEALGLA